MMTDAPSETDLLLEQHVLLGTVAGGARSVDVFADGAADWHGPKMPGAAGFFPAGRRMKSRWPGTRLTYIKLAIRPQATEELLHFKVAEALAADPADRLAALSAETLATSLHLHLASRFSSLRISYGAACEGLGRALDLIHASLPRTVSLGEMVEASNLPRARFLLAFARQTGFSPRGISCVSGWRALASCWKRRGSRSARSPWSSAAPMPGT